MKKILLSFLFLICFVVVQGASKKLITARTVVAGRVINFDSTDQKVVAVNYCDPLSQGSKVAVRFSENGEFHTAYNMSFNQNITISYGGKFINIMAAPADSIFVEIDVKRLYANDWEGVLFTGSSANVNNKLNGLVNYIYPLIDVNLDLTLPANQFITDLKGLLSSLNDSISVYAEKHNLPSELKNWVERDVKYIVVNNIMDYGIGHDDDRFRVFTDPIFDLYNDSNFTTMYFTSDIWMFLNVFLNADDKYKTAIKEGNILNMTLKGVEILGSLPSSLTRDMLLYMFLSNIIGEYPEIYDDIPKDIFIDSLFVSRLSSLNIKIDDVKFSAVAINGVTYLKSDNTLETVQEQDILAYIAARHPNKVIYIDVYATWCGQCRAEFAYVEELNKLLDGKDVVFVYLCLSSEQKKWMETIVKLKINGENYHFDSDATEQFMSVYGLSGYPSYLLIDRNGRVVTNKAPRPSEINKIIKAIDDLLK